MKKIIALVLATLMLLGLVACSAPADEGDEAKANFKVGAIYINSKNDTAGYTYAHHHGITEAMKHRFCPRLIPLSVRVWTSSSVFPSVISMRLRRLQVRILT